ncbi:MAG: DUF2294 domain-containing protein [Fibrobacter sp.]|nr:DUF2294 domain-containing protein [Fibrobacter sp.]
MIRPLLHKTKGQIEAEISDALTRFEKEHMGRGPLETKTYILEDMIIVRFRGVLTRSELALAKSDKNARARELIKLVRIELIENGRDELEDKIRSLTRRRVRSLHTDISTATGEKVIIFTLDRPIEFD